MSNDREAMTIARFFRDRLGARLQSARWSWGATSESGEVVYLRVWDDQFRSVKGRRCVCLWDPEDDLASDGGEHTGASERRDHVQLIKSGARALCVIATPVDRTHREIKSFDETALMVGGDVIGDSAGRLWLEDAGRCSAPAPDKRPRLVKRVDRSASDGPSARPPRQDPSRDLRTPETRPGNRRDGPRVRATPRHEPRELESSAGASHAGVRSGETALQSLQRTLDAPDGVFSSRETRRDSARERHRSREAALQLLYQWDVGRIGASEVDDALDLFWAVHPAPEQRRRMALGLARGVVSALPEIDLLIARHTDNWRSERLAVVDRLIMRLAVYELLFEKTPPPVVINEALELAKTFSGDRAVAFINGVLDAVRRAIVQQGEGSAVVG